MHSFLMGTCLNLTFYGLHQVNPYACSDISDKFEMFTSDNILSQHIVQKHSEQKGKWWLKYIRYELIKIRKETDLSTSSVLGFGRVFDLSKDF